MCLTTVIIMKDKMAFGFISILQGTVVAVAFYIGIGDYRGSQDYTKDDRVGEFIRKINGLCI